MNENRNRNTAGIVAGIIIGILFGWLIIDALIMLFGATIAASGYIIVYGIPVLIVAGIVYLVVKRFRERREFNEWRRSRK